MCIYISKVIFCIFTASIFDKQKWVFPPIFPNFLHVKSPRPSLCSLAILDLMTSFQQYHFAFIFGMYMYRIHKIIGFPHTKWNQNCFFHYLAHLSRKLKWAVLIKSCPSLLLLSLLLSLTFHIFILQNHWANFNQTWHKAYLVKGDSSLSKWRAVPFPKGR